VSSGALSLDTGELLDALLGRGTEEASVVLWQLRVPRTVLGIVVGAGLGIAAVLLRCLTGVTGADAGALGIVPLGRLFSLGAGVVLGTLLAGVRLLVVQLLLAIVGAVVVTVLVLIAARILTTPTRRGALLLSGLVLSLVIVGLGLLLQRGSGMTAASSTLVSTIVGLGSLATADWTRVIVCGLVLLPTAVLAVVVVLGGWRPRSEGPDVEDRDGGTGPGVVRLVIGGVAIAGIAGTVAACTGTIPFVGMLGVGVAWLIAGEDRRAHLLLAPVLAAAALVAADAIGGSLFSPLDLPVAVVTGVIGLPVLLATAIVQFVRTPGDQAR
jgi:iron complex transport system permease protein